MRQFLIIFCFILSFFPSHFSNATAKTPKPVIAPRFDRVIEQIEFRDITVGDALRILAEQSNINIIASKKASEISVAMFLRKVTAMDVIDAISKTYNLWYQYDEKSNIIRIYTVQEYRLEQVEFKKEETEVFTLKNAKNALDFADTIRNLFSSRVYLSYGQNQQQILTDLRQRFERFDLIDKRTKQQFNFSSGSGAGANNTRSQQSNNSSQSNNQSSSQSNNSRGGNSQNSLITPNVKKDNTGTMDETLSETSEFLGQIGDEKKGNKVLDSTLSGNAEDSAEFVDTSIRHQAPIYVGVIKHQNRVLVRTRDADAMTEIKEIYKRLDIESSMLLMEVKVLSIDLSDGYNSLFDLKLKSGNGSLSTNNATSGIDALKNGLKTAAGAFDPSLLTTLVSESFEARLQLLEKENRVTEVATPMLLTSNQEVSRFLVGSTIPVLVGYQNGQTTTSSTGLNTTQQQTTQGGPVYEQRSIGNTLLLTPNINADNTVNIQILIEQSAVSKEAASMLFPTNTGALENHLIDVVHEKTFSGSVIASDGKAVAVGGLIEEGATNQESKVPVLGDVPGLGFFFKDDAKNRKRTELVIIIKPHIINSPAEAEEISQTVLRKNSIHPFKNNDSMDVYSNPDKSHQGYVLEKPYKEYDLQDKMDKYQHRGDSREFPNTENQSYNAPIKPRAPAINPNVQQIYMDLTRYAAKSVRVVPEKWEKNPNILPNRLQAKHPVNLINHPEIKTIPVASWHQGGINVTALEVRNNSNRPVQVDHKHLRGQWLASTIEESNLAPYNNLGDSTYLYLISAMSFEEALQQ